MPGVDAALKRRQSVAEMTPETLDLDDLCAVIGYSATRAVAAWFPGRRLYVPATYEGDHPLVQLLGSSVVQRLIAEFPGERLAVPASEEDRRYARLRLIAEMLAGGATCEAIGAVLELSPRRVEQIRVDLETNGWLLYAHGARSRNRGRPAGGALPQPDLMLGKLGSGEVFHEPPGVARAA